MRKHVQRVVHLMIGLALLWSLVPVQVFAASSGLDAPVADGHFYKQANGLGGQGSQGFTIWNESNGPHFYDRFLQLGGVSALGYPASRSFLKEGFIYQATQGALLQYHPGLKQVFLANTFE